MLRFLRENAPWLLAGGLFTFGSSFGQTFFISIFSNEIRGAFDLSHTAWASAYWLGTMSSAALMLLAGGVADVWKPMTLMLAALCGLACVCMAMAGLPGAWALPFVIFGLRFFGQGMLPHIGLVLAGRWFSAQRGRAVAIITLGIGIGEAILPFLFTQIILIAGWRGTWAIAAFVPLLLMIPLALLLRRDRVPKGAPGKDGSTGCLGGHWTRKQALSHWFFWALLPGTLTMPVFGTAFIFQQEHLIAINGWREVDYYALLPIYPISGMAFLMLGGWAVDRFGAGRVLPLALLALAVGLTVFALADTLVVAAFGFVALGLMMGLSSTYLGAIWPEYYGTRHLGAIRSAAAAFFVFGTGLGPLITSALIDAGIDYRTQLLWIAAYAVGVSALSFLAVRRVTRQMPDPLCPPQPEPNAP